MAYLNPQWGWMADVWLGECCNQWMLADGSGVPEALWGGSMCGDSHVCLSRFAAAFFAHGKPSTAESSANYDKQSEHVNIF